MKIIVKPESEVPKFKVPKSRPKGLGLTLKSNGQRVEKCGKVWRCVAKCSKVGQRVAKDGIGQQTYISAFLPNGVKMSVCVSVCVRVSPCVCDFLQKRTL